MGRGGMEGSPSLPPPVVTPVPTGIELGVRTAEGVSEESMERSALSPNRLLNGAGAAATGTADGVDDTCLEGAQADPK